MAQLYPDGPARQQVQRNLEPEMDIREILLWRNVHSTRDPFMAFRLSD
jgi:hypothetical protein